MTESGKMTSGMARASLPRYATSCVPSHFGTAVHLQGCLRCQPWRLSEAGGADGAEGQHGICHVCSSSTDISPPFLSCDLEKLQDTSSFSPYLVRDAHFWGHDHLISFPIHLCHFEQILRGSDVFILEVICQMDHLLCDQKDTFCYIFISRLF